MSDIQEPMFGTFHDVLTGVIITRELTAAEIAELPEPLPPLIS